MLSWQGWTVKVENEGPRKLGIVVRKEDMERIMMSAGYSVDDEELN